MILLYTSLSSHLFFFYVSLNIDCNTHKNFPSLLPPIISVNLQMTSRLHTKKCTREEIVHEGVHNQPGTIQEAQLANVDSDVPLVFGKLVHSSFCCMGSVVVQGKKLELQSFCCLSGCVCSKSYKIYKAPFVKHNLHLQQIP